MLFAAFICLALVVSTCDGCRAEVVKFLILFSFTLYNVLFAMLQCTIDNVRPNSLISSTILVSVGHAISDQV